MDERIDLTDNRDFRDKPELRSSNIIAKHKQDVLWKHVSKKLQKIREESCNKKITLNAGSLYISEEYDTIDNKMTCDRCGRRFVINDSMLCSKCDAEVSAEIYRHLGIDTHLTRLT